MLIHPLLSKICCFLLSQPVYDALAVGITFAFLNVKIIPAVSFIGIITFILSVIGVKVGSVFGPVINRKADLRVD